ncbi:MAG TPA: transcription termination factor Rho, partial [Acidimicrobiales bacterium]|nr:transcription termination factor Rho [Acidimicrobiales bacterium]
MSDSSTDFDRSQLERKDREQLVVIATTLGKKPPSRARKAEIVDLILELAGVTTGQTVGSDTAGNRDDAVADDPTEPKSDASARSEADTSTDKPPARSGSGRNAGAEGKTGSDRADSRRADSKRSDSDEKVARNASDDARNGGDRKSAGVKNSGSNGSADKDTNQRSQSSVKDEVPSSPDASESNDSRNGDNQGESAGRRRRRRGRGSGGQNDGQPEADPIDVEGILDLRDDGYGFLRLRGYLAHRDDSYVSVKQVRQFGLRKGDQIKGLSRPPTRSEKNPALLRIDEVNGAEPNLARERPHFADLTPEYPSDPLRLEHRDTIIDMTPRIIDLVAPIGKGQRGLIVAPPKSGKTTILKTIARAIEQNHPETHLMVLLVDERPEEVTDFERWIGDGEVVSSTFDRPSDEHTIVAELAIERAKRIAESGGDVVLLVDGITRLTRAYNLTVKESGRLMSGGIDAAAIWPAKRFFGAARKLAEGGSLTILATALVDTNSRMDDHIFEEFKGTGNAELRLDRRLAESRIYPAIDVAGSGTRHEELLFTKPEQARITKLRRVLAGVPADASGPGA